MKNLLTKTLFISLLSLAAIPSNVWAASALPTVAILGVGEVVPGVGVAGVAGVGVAVVVGVAGVAGVGVAVVVGVVGVAGVGVEVVVGVVGVVRVGVVGGVVGAVTGKKVALAIVKYRLDRARSIRRNK